MAEDILDTLRDCLQNRRLIREVNGKINVAGRNFPKHTETTFPIRQIKGARKSNKCKKFYNLEAIYFFLENQNLPHYEYAKKAQEKGIASVTKLDRKPLLARIGGEAAPSKKSTLKGKATEYCAKLENPSAVSRVEPEPLNRKQSSDQDSSEIERQRPHVRTYSRKRSSHEFRSSSRRQSLGTEEQLFDLDVGVVNTDVAEELALLKTENINLERSLRNVISFLKDHLGATEEQLMAMQECESNTVELSSIASSMKNKIVYASILSSGDSQCQVNQRTPRFCYKAVRHPTRGWEMIKQSLSSALSGREDSNTSEMEESKSISLDESLSKGTVLLKRAFSMLISQMRESSRFKTHEEFDTFCQKIILDCLAEAVDSFRELFNGLLSSQKTDEELGEVDRWVDICRTELVKLFQSLTRTLQSLRDIPTIQHKQPISLFHLPAPTFSLALNPAKVTHSVVLEMYVRFGVAELQRILMNILDCGPHVPLNNSYITFSPNSSNEKANNNNESKICHSWSPTSTSEEVSDLTTLQDQVEISPPHQSETQFKAFCETPILQSCKTDTNLLALNQETIQQEKFDTDSSLSSSSQSSPRSHLINRVLFQQNGNSEKFLNSTSTYQTRRLSEGDYGQYSKFKTSLGNTMVSSFKKRIQEKIQASTSDIL
ncbi:Parafibromin [Frankliniella fusca]|uniref:Parafibromin n=1 Tax=Frankliniella fusca TaxID=407009 RepID=A0AAE1GRC0_9NEOP|nr:Parafibromin [Frankliniella fusca]